MSPKNKTSSQDLLNFSPLHRKVSLQERINAKNGKWMAGLAITSIVLLVGAFIYGLAGQGIGVASYIIVLALILLFAFATLFVSIRINILLEEFAKANNMIYWPTMNYDNRAGMIFNQGRLRSFSEVLSSDTRGFSEIGNYQYTVGSGKNRRTYRYGYVRIKLPRRLPNMILDSKKNNYFGGRISNLPEGFGKDQRLSLEGDFDKYFTLYAPAQYKRDALYVFTPDVMHALITAAHDYDCEVVDDDFYIYSSKTFVVYKQKDLEDIMKIVSKLGKELIEQADYYADERVGDRTMNIVAAPGARLKTRMSTISIIIFGCVTIYFLIDIIGSFVNMVKQIFFG